jgi:hypothetical protein
MSDVTGIASGRADSRIGAWAQREVAAMTPRDLGSHGMKDIGPMRRTLGRLDQLQRRMRHRGRFSKPSLSRGCGICSVIDNEMTLHSYEEFGKRRAQKLRGILRLRSGMRAQNRPPQTAPAAQPLAQEHDA